MPWLSIIFGGGSTMKKDNPFTLTFGRQPNEYINRYENMDSIISTFEADNPISQTFLIEGIRGSGKTVLMTAIENELSQNDNWVIVSLNSTRELLDDLAMRLSNEYKKVSSALKSGFNISVGGFGVGINGSNPENSIIIIEDIFDSLKKKNKRILITIDEVMHDDNMKRFASEFQLFIRKNYPIYLLMTGLYENIYAIQNDPALTFLLRAPKICMEPLSIHQIAKQYKRVFDTDDDKSKKLAQITKGYAFAFQALGLLYYEYHDTLSLDEILSKLDDMLDDFVYKKIWSTLSDLDKKILSVFDENPMKVKTICEKADIQSSTFSRYRERLINRGLIIASQHGYVSLTLPRFSKIIASYT
jgi:type IV secretory pathway VirB4 component